MADMEKELIDLWKKYGFQVESITVEPDLTKDHTGKITITVEVRKL